MPLNRSEELTGGFMRIKPTYAWTFSKEPADALVTKQEREARKDIVRYRDWETDRKSTRLNSSHSAKSRMPSSA